MVYSKSGDQLTSVFNVAGDSLDNAYDVGSEIVFAKSVDYSSYTKTDFCRVNIQQMQGFDIFRDYIFQFRANSSNVNNIMCTINAKTSTIIQNDIPAASDHGDSATFSNEYYVTGDYFPLLYVTADTNPGKVYVNRVRLTESQLVKTLLFPLDKAGYYSALCFDVENNIGYMIGYTEQNYQTDDGGANKTLISKWDLSQLTQNQDGTYTPLFISSYERPFIYVMQGQQYHDGMLWIASGGSNYNGYVYALDPSSGELLYSVDSGTTVEIEGIAWISNNEMITGHQGGTYYKFTFGA